jgi:hypothetical protein
MFFMKGRNCGIHHLDSGLHEQPHSVHHGRARGVSGPRGYRSPLSDRGEFCVRWLGRGALAALVLFIAFAVVASLGI